MTDEPTYEYRVVDKHGHEWDCGTTHPRHDWDDAFPDHAPHRYLRRLITPWEDAPDDQ